MTHRPSPSPSSALGGALLWTLCILLFPILSGILSAVLSLGTVETLFLQGAFMLASLAVPLLPPGRRSWRGIGFDRYDREGGKRALHFLPLLVLFVPVAVRGFAFPSPAYVLGSLFLYLSVGIAEEVYFRALIPACLQRAFSPRGVILLSSLLFGGGHIATAFTAGSGPEVLLTVLNALLFGWLAMEMTAISHTILPAILLHFLFDFETKIVAMDGAELLLAQCVRGALLFPGALWLTAVRGKLPAPRP